MRLPIVIALVAALVAAADTSASPNALISIRAITYRISGDPEGTIKFTSLLYNFRRGRNAIGHATLICTYVGSGGPLGSGTSECAGTFVLPRGKITVHGSRKNRSYYVLAVTGGTGLYVNSSGQLIVSSRGTPEGQQRLVFSLL